MRSITYSLTLLLFFSQSSFAQEISQASVFNRCYIQLTGRPVPLNHSLISKVKSGTLTAIDACVEVLHKGRLSAAGEIAERSDDEAKAVLNTFYSFHRTWFPSNTVDVISGYDPFEYNGTVDLYDATEPALALTFSMFGDGQKYSDTLTRDKGVRAIRIEDEDVKTRQGWKTSHPGRFLSNNVRMQDSLFSFRDDTNANTVVSRNINKHVSIKKSVPTIAVGDLVGIRPTSESFIVPNISLVLGRDKGLAHPGLNYSYDFFKTFGGGVLGMPIYLLQYYGHGFNMKFNGSTKTARRWSMQNMESFLCANLPALRESDVERFVDTKSTVPFRNSTSCVMCHATLDRMAYTARNITVGATDIFRVNMDGDVKTDANGNTVSPPPAFLRNAVAITSYKASNESITGWPAAEVENFHLQNPTGRLYFRSSTGALINKPVSGIAELGKAMSETDDYYLCAAKRYFEFMTGVVVPLYDRTDPRNANLNLTLTNEAIKDRSFVENLAQELRRTQSVIEMTEAIMKSPYYGKENYR